MSEPERDEWEEILPFPEVYIKVEPQEAEIRVSATKCLVSHIVRSMYVWLIIILQGSPYHKQ